MLYAGMYTDIYESFPALKKQIFKLANKRNSAHNKDITLNKLLSLQDCKYLHFKFLKRIRIPDQEAYDQLFVLKMMAPI